MLQFLLSIGNVVWQKKYVKNQTKKKLTVKNCNAKVISVRLQVRAFSVYIIYL